MKSTILVIFAIILVGCSSVSSTRSGAFDPTEKTVYIQPGKIRILYPIKEAFTENGWTIEEFEKNNARYMVHLNTKATQMFCWNEFSEIEVELILLDTKMKSEIFSIESKTCDTYSNFKNELDRMLKQ